MAVTVVMPRLSDSMEEGTIIKWMKGEGDPIEKGETLAEIETDKANMQLESYESGILDKIIVAEGGKVPVGEPIAVIRGRDEKPAAFSAPPATAGEKPSGAAVAAKVEVSPPEKMPAPEERLKASPIARRMAAEQGLDLSAITGTGPSGRITKEDVEKFAELMKQVHEKEVPVPPPAAALAPPPPPAPAVAAPPPAAELAEVAPMSRMQATIAKRMAQSKSTVPHFYVTIEVDMQEAVQLRKQINATLGEGNEASFNDMVVKAAALALRRIPHVNASYRDGSIELKKQINVGVAVAVPEGLLVPVIKNADRKTIGEIARESKQIFERIRTNRMQTSDFEGGTFTVSNLGMYDVEEFAAIINPPESAIMAVGSIKKKPVVIDDNIVVSERMRLTLSVDHRVFYGATAAEFLQEVKRLMEKPMSLLV